jgi:hypothetical protein
MPTGKALQDIKTMLAHLGGSRTGGKTQKVSAELMRRKLAYLIGQNVDCMPILSPLFSSFLPPLLSPLPLFSLCPFPHILF